MYRICIEKLTGKLIEMQSGDAPLGILTQNAINAGFKIKDIEEKYVTEEEWLQITETIKPETIDYQDMWKKAVTVDDKLKVIGGLLNLEETAGMVKNK